MRPRDRGASAEDWAAGDLRRHGFEVLARNVRMQRGELDLVARRGGVLYFVEIKSRGRADRGEPHLAVDRRKSRALYAAAREFLVRTGHLGDYAFLVGSVLPGPRIRWSTLPITPPSWTAED